MLRTVLPAVALCGLIVAAAYPFRIQVNSAGAEEAATDSTKVRNVTAQEALVRLKEGNQRFAEEHSTHPHEERTWRLSLESGQHPFATILGCADSRVCPELIFDQGLGDLFVIRVAGNVVDPDVAGSIEYAVHHLKTRLIVVLGHEHCGAVTAAFEELDKGMDEPIEVKRLLRSIAPGIEAIPKSLKHDERVHRGVTANVRHSIEELRRIKDLRNAEKTGEVKIVGAVYDLHNGRIRFLD
ncbi:carbonic anhydrase [Stratiformator vulcanicus]|uniref:Carbonic anhydrase n=1 Tax=Stratiformator vulcanicus TaxID=2527980 RepID=A0A517R180_9PLAN|nr:carbonic anhydrase [Stratiformator vulcanicus]QDT37600.1 Carbonic anhydrase 2 [Stratiformator vulcanicus]